MEGYHQKGDANRRQAIKTWDKYFSQGCEIKEGASGRSGDETETRGLLNIAVISREYMRIAMVATYLHLFEVLMHGILYA